MWHTPVGARLQRAVDPLATKYASLSPYNFSFNDPVTFNDPNGADPWDNWLAEVRALERWFENTMPEDYSGNSGWGGGAYYNSMMGGYGASGYMGHLSSTSAASTYGNNVVEQNNILNALKARFSDATFSSGGTNGFWIKTTGVDRATEGLKFGNSTLLGGVLNRNIFVSGISLNHFNTMTNSLVQSIHKGQQAFIENPFGGALMAFLSGAPAGGLGNVVRGVGNLVRASTPAVTRGVTALGHAGRTGLSVVGNNLVQTGARNGVINLSTQLFFNEGDISDLDFLDVATSSISGNSFVFAGAASALFNGSLNGGFSTAASSSVYSTSVSAATAVAFGFLGGKAGSVLGPGGSGFASELTISIYGSLFNWTLSPPAK